MPDKILYVNHSAQVSGAERSLLATLAHLDRDRFAPTVACPEGALADRARALGVAVAEAPLFRIKRERNPARLAAACMGWRRGQRAIKRILAEGGFSLVHANSTTAQLFAGGAAAKARVPCVWHVRDLSPLAPAGGYCARRARAVVCISRAVAEHVRRSVPRAADLRVIHNGIDALAFAKSAQDLDLRGLLGWPRDAFVLAMLAQFTPWKRHEDFIEAIRRLADRGRDARGVVAGGDLFGDQADYAAQLDRLVADAGMESRIAFLGWREDAASVIQASDAVAVPSDAEPFGRVALEGMALAKPVVGTRAGGLPEIVAEGETGLLVPPRDPGALADAVLKLAEEPALARELGAAGARRVRERFDIRDKVSEIEALYCELLGKNGP